MYTATAIKMKPSNIYNYNMLTEIKDIYLFELKKWYPKESLYDFLVENPKSIKVSNSYGPFLIPSISSNNEKYVRSEANSTTIDNLLQLPKY